MCSAAHTSSIERPSDGPADLAQKVAQLRELCGPGDEVVETHFAWIFLIGDRALKLRKPVLRETMDYRTIDLRRVDSEEDVRLNRRLAPDVYLRTLPLVRRADGRIVPGGAGEIVDWLVEMRRLDRRWFLDAALERGDVSASMLDRVAGMLATFYASAAPAISRPGEIGPRLAAQAGANGRAIEAMDAPRSVPSCEVTAPRARGARTRAGIAGVRGLHHRGSRRLEAGAHSCRGPAGRHRLPRV